MLTLINKMKLFYLSRLLPIKALRLFSHSERNEDEIRSNNSTPNALPRLTFRRNRKFVWWPSGSALRLSEARTSAMVSQMETLSDASSVSLNDIHELCKKRKEVQRITGLVKRSLFRIFHGVLNLHHYKLLSLHQLLPNDPDEWEEFVRWGFSNISSGAHWLLNLLWMDEAIFSLHGTLNIDNCRIREQENSHDYTEEPLHTLCCLVWLHFIFDSFFFKEHCAKPGWKLYSVIGDLYLKIPKQKIIPSLL